MPATARESYVETEIRTASPQKLQLMLIEGAMRYAERAKRHWEQEKNEEACENLIRAQELITEILAGLKPDFHPQLVRKCANLYAFVFRRLLEANLERSTEKLDAALRVLELERETWQQLCQRLGEPGQKASRPTPAAPATDPAMRPEKTSPGLSLEA